MSSIPSTLRRINGKLFGGTNHNRSTCGGDFKDEGGCDYCANLGRTASHRQFAEQEAREMTVVVNQDGLSALLDSDIDYSIYEESPEDRRNFQKYEILKSLEDRYVDAEEYIARPGTIIFDTPRAIAPFSDDDPCWEGLKDDLDAMQDFYRGKIQEHEIHLDGISSTHYYHANRTGIIAVDRFDLYGDRDPSAWWPILECS